MTARRLGAAIAVMAAGLSIGAAAAEARSTFSARPTLGPILAGSRVIWVEDRGRGFRVIDRWGSSHSVLARRSPPAQRNRRWAAGAWQGALAATGVQAVVPAALFKTTRLADDFSIGERLDIQLLTGQPRDELQATSAGESEGCRVGSYPTADVYNTSIALGDWNVCGERKGSVAVVTQNGRVLTPPPSESTSLESNGVGRVRFAGRYLAWSLRKPGFPDSIRVVVYDIANQRVVYSVYPSSVGAEGFSDFALQEDGKVVVLYDTAGSLAGRGRLAISSPHVPKPRRLRRDARLGAVEMARDHIVYLRRVGRSGPRAELAILPIGRRPERLAAFGAKRRLLAFDFDGDRVAWASRQRGRTRIVVRGAPRGF